MCVFIKPTSQALSMMSWGQVPSLSYSHATLRMSFSAKLCASSRRSFCSSVRVRSTTDSCSFGCEGAHKRGPIEVFFRLIDWSVSQP